MSRNELIENLNNNLGFRNKDAVMLEEEFKGVSNTLVISTDDGTYANKGYIIDELQKAVENKKVDCIFACGPLPLLKAVQKLAIKKDYHVKYH